MRHSILGIAIALTAAADASAAETPTTDQLVGRWIMVMEGNTAPKVAVEYAFAADHGFRTRLADQVFRGTYSLEGSTLSITFQGASKPDYYTVKELSAGTLVLVDNQSNLRLEFKRR